MSPAQSVRPMYMDARAEVVLLCGDDEVARWPFLCEGAADLGAVDQLMRLQLEARRQGCTLWLRHACPDLLALLRFVGLAGVLQVRPPAREAGADGSPHLEVQPPAREAGAEKSPHLQVRREAEGLEQRGVEEVVVADDPVA